MWGKVEQVGEAKLGPVRRLSLSAHPVEGDREAVLKETKRAAAQARPPVLAPGVKRPDELAGSVQAHQDQ